ncbi:MAG: hypothetical protein EOP92_37450 [Lysobacteraceae bacterium]|nr:MAG: hypothetical protein EOP92_37450 [Xanthomonadaceae bacterium]
MDTTLEPSHAKRPAAVRQDIALWNPAAAALWSVALSPAFGAWLHMRNWERLGEQERAKEARAWFATSCGLHAVNLLIVLLGAALHRDVGIPHSVSFAFLAVWYIRSGHAQVRYVDKLHGAGYARRPWRAPLLLGAAAIAVLVLLTAIPVLAVSR